ncbi:hypothetical protein GS8_3267 [Geobacillus stearothermophilus]|uniref:Uncharacterized protein n=1 Tax=Geobacillus stearothermophilus TaxID=1422 RepID=A0ABQ7HB65_GEOSE|nr:hypothetical protein GS8_3267 [Geobacillus stearothermophilus]
MYNDGRKMSAALENGCKTSNRLWQEAGVRLEGDLRVLRIKQWKRWEI